MICMKFRQKFKKKLEFEVCFLCAKFVSGRGSAAEPAETTLPQTLYSRCPPPHSITLRHLPNTDHTPTSNSWIRHWLRALCNLASLPFN